MAKNKNKKIEKNIKKDIEKKEVSTEVKQLLAITVAVLLFLGLFYFLTVFILDDDTSTKTDDDTEVEVQFDEILIGKSFSLKDSEYYVLYYETNDEDISSDMASLVSTYRSSNKDLYLYTVDMSNALNSQFIADVANEDASKASELKINGPTLIKFVDGEIDEYIDGVDDITEELE